MNIFKIFRVLLLAAIGCGVVSGMTLDETKKMMLGVATECVSTEGAADADLSRLVSKQPPNTPEGKCLFACIVEDMEIVSGGKLNKEGFMDYCSSIFGGDAAKMKSAEELVKECGGISDSDRCELGIKVGGCLKMSAAKKKLDLLF